MAELTHEELKALYLPGTDEFVIVDVPRMKYFMVTGQGPADGPAFQDAVRWLWAVVHPIRQIAKQRMGRAFVEPPLECLWWTDDPADFIAGRTDKFRWQVMVPTAEWVEDAMLADAISEVSEDRGDPPDTLRLDHLHEGPSVQIMHIGSYADAAAGLTRRLHEEFLPAQGLEPNGHHHEIYLTDPRRTAPERTKTVLRQPVRER